MTQKYILLIILSLSILSCQDNSPTNGDSDGNDDNGSTPEPEETSGDFVMGADLDYIEHEGSMGYGLIMGKQYVI